MPVLNLIFSFFSQKIPIIELYCPHCWSTVFFLNIQEESKFYSIVCSCVNSSCVQKTLDFESVFKFFKSRSSEKLMYLFVAAIDYLRVLCYYLVKCSGSKDTQILVQIQTELPKFCQKLSYPSKCEFPHSYARNTYGTKIIPLL